MTYAKRQIALVAALSLVLSLVMPIVGQIGLTSAWAAGEDFVGGPLSDDTPRYIPNDHTPQGIRFTASGLLPNTQYEVKIRLSPNENPSGNQNRGYTWNPTSGQWVANRGPAWGAGLFPTATTDASGNIVTSDWYFFKFANEGNSGAYYIIVTLNAGGDGSAQNAVTKTPVTVLDMASTGAWVHPGAAGATNTSQAARRITATKAELDSSTAEVWAMSRTEDNLIDDDGDGVVDNEVWGPAGVAVGDYRVAVPINQAFDVYVQTSQRVNDRTLATADQSIALGAADQEAPSAPTGLTAEVDGLEVDLAWNAASDNVAVTEYQVYRWSELSAVEFTARKELIATTASTSYTDTSATPGVAYKYIVRAKDAATNVSARSNTVEATVDVPDPTVEASVSPVVPDGSGGWYRAAVPTITLAAQNGTAYYSWSESGPFSIYDGPIAAQQGDNTLYYYAEGDYSNRSTTQTLSLKVDTAAPVATVDAPKYSTRETYHQTYTISWGSADGAGSSGGITYDVEYKKGSGGSWKRSRTGTTATSRQHVGPAGTTYYWRVRATDAAGNVGSWTTAKPTTIPHDNAVMSFSGSWKTMVSPNYYLGSARRSTGIATATMSFRGGSAAYLVTAKTARQGRVQVYIDGKYIKTINLYSAKTVFRTEVPLGKLTGTATTKHTVRLVSLPSKGRPYVTVDGLAVVR